MSKIWTAYEDSVLAHTSLSYDLIREKFLPHRTKRSIWSRAAKLGYRRNFEVIQKVNSENQRKDEWTKLVDDREFCEIVDGELLGDGCIFRKKVKNRQCYEYSFIAGSVRREYAEYVHRKIGSKLDSKARIKTCQSSGEKDFYSVRFSNVVFKNFYERWYTNGTHKIHVPQDFELSPSVCLHWYLGDGSLDSSARRHMFEITLHTECFDRDSIEYLMNRLSQNVGIAVKTRKSKQWRALRIHGDDARQFLNYIGYCPVASMAYKWRDWR